MQNKNINNRRKGQAKFNKNYFFTATSKVD